MWPFSFNNFNAIFTLSSHLSVLSICCEMSRHTAVTRFEHLRKITKLFRVSSCNFYSRPFHIRGFIIFQILFWHREIEVARAAAPGHTRQYIAYIARYRDFVISRDVHVAISVGSQSKIANFSKNSRKFFRAMTAAAFHVSSALKQSITSRRFPPKRRYMVAVNSGIVQTTHTRLRFWFVAGQTAPRRFDTRSLTLRSVTSPGFWDIRASLDRKSIWRRWKLMSQS